MTQSKRDVSGAGDGPNEPDRETSMITTRAPVPLAEGQFEHEKFEPGLRCSSAEKNKSTCAVTPVKTREIAVELV